MSGSAYSFLPWLRQGLANNIAVADLDAGVRLRASVPVRLTLTGDGVDGAPRTQAINREVQLYGPGDIVGIDRRAIVRTDPRENVTNFEPNYVPCVEFYDEDFPWRYTPAAPDVARHRLRPWIMLIVLADGEFEEGGNIADRPLPHVVVPNAANVFPPADQLWAWAHVHVNRGITPTDADVVSDDRAATAARLQSTLDENADLACSRIVSPRKLSENSGYTAFLVPVFESGRLAGLGLDPATAPHATFSAWADYPGGSARPQPDQFPYYHRWYFRTGGVGDFEYLVRLLQPKPVDSRVGYRDLDVQAPGSNLPGITTPELGGVLKLGGALRAPLSSLKPDERVIFNRYENWATPYPHAFQEALARFVNLADDYAAQAAAAANAATGLGAPVQGDPDPLITPPLYGRWHSLTQRLLNDRDGRLLANRDNWVHELNLDPRFRVAAGFGTRVVQDNQEAYMDAAWEQIGAVLEANRRIRLAQLARETGRVWYTRDFTALATTQPERAFALLAPVHRRVVTDGLTVHQRVRTSAVPQAAMSAPLRRMLRPRGRLVRALPFTGAIQPGTLLTRLNAGEVSAAPPKTVPPGVLTTEDVAREVETEAMPPFIATLLHRAPWPRFAALVLLALLVLLVLLMPFSGVLLGVAAVAAAGLAYLHRQLTQWGRVIAVADTVRGTQATPGAAQGLPKSPDFHLSEPGVGFVPQAGNTDSAEAVRFKSALDDWYTLRTEAEAAGVEPVRPALALPALGAQTLAKLHPQETVPRAVLQSVAIPARIRALIGEAIDEVKAYPELDIPMYEPLAARSTEQFVPNVHLVEDNSVTLLESNQKFLEAYMAGLNHELSRELHWRGFPTDLRGTYFRQFWDTKGYLDTTGLAPEQLRERLRDIPPMHLWPRASHLGDHDNRQQGGVAREEVVLAIRGELLKKYPTAVIYAHRAEWQRGSDGRIDNTKERVPVRLTAAEEANPPAQKVRTPLYEAQIAPDIYFFGFDLTVTEARGGTGEHETDSPGWFFVIKERPGEPRFGFDIQRDGALNVWNDLAWNDVRAGITSGQYVEITNATPALTLVRPSTPDVAEKLPQWEEDRFVSWSKDTNAADVGYILYQAPVRVMIHAAEMLPPGS